MSGLHDEEILGFEFAEKYFYEEYSRPLLLLGPPGQGKRSWANEFVTTVPNSFPVITIADKPSLVSMAQHQRSSMNFAYSLEVKYLSGRWSPTLISSVLKNAPSNFKIIAHTTFDVGDIVKDVCHVVHTPFLSDEQMFSVADRMGLKPDEAEFAVKAANGIPGDISRSFDLLRARQNIFDGIAAIIDGGVGGITRCAQVATAVDVLLLKDILMVLETGDGAYFTQQEVEPFRRVSVLMRNVLYGLSSTVSPYAIVSAIFTAASHAYHGRV